MNVVQHAAQGVRDLELVLGLSKIHLSLQVLGPS